MIGFIFISTVYIFSFSKNSENNSASDQQPINTQPVQYTLEAKTQTDQSQARCIEGNCINSYGTQIYADGRKYTV